jgi:hypothetical protein
MAFIAPTGLTMAFTAALYRFTGLAGLPFLETYGWVGLWTSGMLLSLASGGFAQLIKFCTSFTDDVFNALLALNFSVEAMQALLLGFAVAGPDKTAPFLALNFALFTCFASLKVRLRQCSIGHRLVFYLHRHANVSICAVQLNDFVTFLATSGELIHI